MIDELYGAVTLMPRLLSEVAGNAAMHEIFYAQLVEPRRAVLRTEAGEPIAGGRFAELVADEQRYEHRRAR